MVLAHNIDQGNRTSDVQIVQNVTFDTMLLTSDTLQGLKKSGFYKPSPVQLHGIPLGKCGFDLLLEAKSGTGKTAVFTVLTLEKLDLEKELQTVILAPTREIASQICDVIKEIGSYYEGLIVEVVMGGLPVEEDICKFKKTVHVVVGSPGRLRHLIQAKHIDVSSVRLMVLDEADKLMEKSFQADINYIFSILPAQKQVIMSSATYPETTKAFINKYVKCAQLVCPDSNCVLLGVEQKITVVKYNTNIVRQTKYRFEELLKILTERQFKQCLIFCNYQTRVAELYKLLIREKWPVEQLCGQQEQTDRLDALKTLKEYNCRILVSTDLAARGIDASNVDLVINFEPPLEWQTYLHRIGRAGRFGSYGMSITVLSEGKEEIKFKNILETINLNSSKIGNLWSDNEPGNNDFTNLPLSHANSQNNKTELEDIYKDVWNDLISGCIKNDKEELEEFDTLCKSFEESNQLKIETFTNLIASFENSEKNASVKDTYHFTKMPKPKAFKSFFESMRALKEYNYNENKRFPIMERSQKESNNNLPDALSNGYNNQHYELKETTGNTISENKKNKQLNKKGLDENNTENSNNLLDNTAQENLDASFSKALIDAGLPTSFGTTKNNQNYKNINKMKTNNSRRAFNEEVQVEYYGIENYQQYNNYTTNQKIIDRSSHTNNVQPNRKQKFGSSKLNNKHNQHNTPIYKNTGNLTKVRSNSNNIINTDILHKNKDICQFQYTENYLVWYNQLKNTVKQIEIALYIEELTKL